MKDPGPDWPLFLLLFSNGKQACANLVLFKIISKHDYLDDFQCFDHDNFINLE